MIRWEERITRGAATALMNNFTSVADALNELVDNAVNYRWGQPLQIDIDVKDDRITVESDGGRGMGAVEINTWLCWGQGDEHDEGDISRYHQGGKAAIGFLGQRVRLWAKLKDTTDIWLFEDEDWDRRQDPRDFGVPQPLAPEAYPPSMRALAPGRGHVLIEISHLTRGRRKNVDDLRRALSSTYRKLLQHGELTVRVCGQPVKALEIPLSPIGRPIQLSVGKLAGRRSADGWAGKLNRDELATPIKSGIRLLHAGRLICDGEWFGYNHEGKGALNSLIGELELHRFTPTPNKTNFVERGDDVWQELGQAVLEQLMPLISELRRPGDDARVTPQEKHLAQEVARELGQILQEGAIGRGHEDGPWGADKDDVGPDGRKRPERRGGTGHADVDPDRPERLREPRTEAPEDAVGELARIVKKLSGGATEPPIRIGSWDPYQRSAWVPEGRQVFLRINKRYPMYIATKGAKAYIAETAILELCRPREGAAPVDVATYAQRVNHLLYRWHEAAGLLSPNSQSES